MILATFIGNLMAQLTCCHSDDGFQHRKELHSQWEGQALDGEVGLVEQFQQSFGNLQRFAHISTMEMMKHTAVCMK